MSFFERLSKTAVSASVLLIVLLLLRFHPDLTPLLRALTGAAILISIFVPSRFRPALHVVWLAGAMVAPAVLRLMTAREGPVLDLFWMSGLSASLLRTASWSRWSLPARWRIWAAGWALTVSLAWPVVLAREAGFSIRLLTDDGAINSWGLLSAPQVAAWVLFTAWTQLLGILFLEWGCRQFEEDRNRVVPVLHGLWMGATIASLVAVYQGTVDLGFLSTPFWASLARATGTLLDANAFGVCAALAGPIALLALRLSSQRRDAPSMLGGNIAAAFAFAVLVINLAGLWMSGSRTAVLCALITTIVFAIGIWPALTPRTRRVVPWAGGAVVALMAIIAFGSNTIGPARRLADIPTSLRSGLSTIFQRGPYGAIANEMIRTHPAVGVGLGTYQILAPDYWRRQANDALPFDNAQNWWRHQLSELGIVGSAMLFIWSAVLTWHVVFGAARRDHRIEATIVRGLIAAIGIASFIQVPTQTPIVMLTFMLMVGWSSVLIPTPTEARSNTAVTWASVAAIVLAVGYAGGHLILAGGSLAVTERARQAHREYAVGTFAPEVMEGHEFRWTRRDARFIWPVKTRWLVVRLWVQHPDMAHEPVRITLTTPCGVLFDGGLSTPMPTSIGVTLPEGQQILEARLHVSRTWRPSDHGSDDPRELGAGIVADFVTDSGLAVAQNRNVSLTACRPGI